MILRAVVFCAVLFWFSFASCRAGYVYGDNIKDYMASGISSFEKGKLLDAQIDFENILAIEPHHKGALTKLLDVLILRKEKGNALEVLRQIKAGRHLPDNEIAAAEKKIQALSEKAPARLVEPQKYALASPSEATSSSSANDSGASTADLLGLDSFESKKGGNSESKNTVDDLDDEPDDEVDESGDDLGDDELDDLDEDFDVEGSSGSSGKAASEGTDATSAKSINDMSPKEQLTAARQIKKQGQTVKAIRVFVSAVMADPSLLSEPDDGLLNLSRNHYLEQCRKDPDNPKYHFFSGFFHDIFSEYQKARDSYKKVTELAPKGSKLLTVAKSKIITIERVMQNQTLAKAESDKEAKEKKEAEFLDAVAMGHHDRFTKPVEYADYAKELYGKWTSSKDNALLDEAVAYYKGAIYLDDKTATYHYGLGLVYIEKAATGAPEYKKLAQSALEGCLKAGPTGAMKESAEKLLKSVSQ